MEQSFRKVIGLVDDGAEAVLRKGHPRRVPEDDFEPRGPLRDLLFSFYVLKFCSDI